ncbi:hypothetical protein IPM09_04205 [Candidatus Saccharibacteria bacterium]|nr:MAG: hypothetical protein IPM09_04205 [Candidatus Saccharibacteria bacterium]
MSKKRRSDEITNTLVILVFIILVGAAVDAVVIYPILGIEGDGSRVAGGRSLAPIFSSIILLGWFIWLFIKYKFWTIYVHRSKNTSRSRKTRQ